jgi:hypothetical protein
MKAYTITIAIIVTASKVCAHPANSAKVISQWTQKDGGWVRATEDDEPNTIMGRTNSNESIECNRSNRSNGSDDSNTSYTSNGSSGSNALSSNLKRCNSKHDSDRRAKQLARKQDKYKAALVERNQHKDKTIGILPIYAQAEEKAKKAGIDTTPLAQMKLLYSSDYPEQTQFIKSLHEFGPDSERWRVVTNVFGELNDIFMEQQNDDVNIHRNLDKRNFRECRSVTFRHSPFQIQVNLHNI